MSKNHDRHFSTKHLEAGLGKRAVKSVVFTLSAQAAKLFIQIGSIAILARLLQPADFGLVAMATIFTGLAMQITDGGLSMATVQRDEITQSQVSNLFWLNCGLGLGFFLLGVIAAPIVSGIYDEPRLVAVMVVMSTTFIIGGLSVQHDALLRRQMRFKSISLIDVSSMAVGLVVSLFAAIKGAGYWALVISPMAAGLSKTVMRWLVCGWVPSGVSRGSGVRPMLNFGANLTGANFIGYFATNITSFAVGYVGGAQALGFYNRAATLTSLPSKQLLPPVMQVMQSVLTRIKNDEERLRVTVLSIMSKIAIVTMLVTIGMVVTAEELVLIFLGEGWGDTVNIFRVLAVASIATPITTFAAIVMVAVGEAAALMRWKIVALIILSSSIAIGSIWGVKGIVLAHCISGVCVRMPGFLIYSTRYQPIKALDFAKRLLPILFGAVGALILTFQAKGWVGVENDWVSAVIWFGLVSTAYLMILCCFNVTRKEVFDLFLVIKIMAMRVKG